MYNIKGNIQLIPFRSHMVNGPYFNWWSDQEVTKYNSHGLFPNNEKDLESFLNNLGNNNIVLAICACDSNVQDIAPIDYKKENSFVEITEHFKWRHIGNVSLQSINWINRSAELAIIIGDKNYWGKGIAKKTCMVLLYHGFRKLNLHRIWTGTAATNEGMKKVAIKIGMKKEGEFADAMFLNGEYVDVIEYGILDYEFEQSVKIVEGLIENIL
jgi:hypothetical protein